jgi:23S rRNA (uracil1939-C5)-methyltransferase
LTLRVEKLVPGGKGYARLADGRVALLEAVVPEDLVEITESRSRKGYLEVTQWRMLEASTHRIEPSCEYASRCGGCDWMMLDAGAQRAAKLELVKEALSRTGKIVELPGDLELIDSPNDFAYRSRIRLQVSRTGRVGFFSSASHDLVEVPNCAVAAPEVNTALQRLRDWAQRHPEALASVPHVEIRSAPNQTASIHFAGHRPHSLALLEDLQRDYTLSWSDDTNDEVWQLYPLRGHVQLQAPPGTFTQVNWAVNQLLIERVVQGALERSVASFADLYCGSGNFTLPLLATGMSGVAVESNAQSIAALRRAAETQGLPLKMAQSSHVEQFVTRAVRDGQHYDLVLLDPPRAGLKGSIEAVAQLASRYIAICSCDPVTLARDLRGLLDRGFDLEKVTAFDMFPQTHHVEVLAWLVRKPPTR